MPSPTTWSSRSSTRSRLIPRLVGVARAKEMLLLGREVSGATAAAWGMVHRAVRGDEVEATAAQLVDELGGAATVAVGLTKLLVQRSTHADLEHQLADEGLALELVSRSEDFHENVRARREKRAPEFRGR